VLSLKFEKTNLSLESPRKELPSIQVKSMLECWTMGDTTCLFYGKAAPFVGLRRFDRILYGSVETIVDVLGMSSRIERSLLLWRGLQTLFSG